MSDTIETTVKGLRLVLLADTFGTRNGDPDLWAPTDHEWDGPTEPRPITDWPRVIDEWRVAKQVEGGTNVWVIDHDDPNFWQISDAVFRSGGQRMQRGYPPKTQKRVEFRNGSDPDQLYSRPLHDLAPDTPEVAEAIERAKAARLEAVAAGKRWTAARKAIQRLSVAEWHDLPPSPKEDI